MSRTPALRSPMQLVGEVLQRDTGAVGRAMVERILREVPIYARASQVVLDDVGELASRNAEVMCAALTESRLPTRDEFRFVAAHVRRRMSSGIGLEPLMHAYRVGNLAFYSLCVEEAVAQGMSRNACLDLVRHAFEVADATTTQAAELFVREENRLKTLSREAARNLLEVLLTGEVAEIGDEPHLAAPGLDPRAPMTVAVCALAESDPGAGDAHEETLASISHHLSAGATRPLVAVRQNEIVVVAGTLTVQRVVERIQLARTEIQKDGTELRAGVSLRVAGFAGVRDGYRFAAAALSHATSERPIIALESLSALDFALLTANADTRSILAGKTAPLTQLSGAASEAFRNTIDAFAGSNMNVMATARRLHIHPNTIRYRLHRIAELTGHDPTVFAELMELIFMLRIDELPSD